MEDIINAEFATVYNEEDGRDGTEEQLEEAESAMRMGQLYSVMGGGWYVFCFLSRFLLLLRGLDYYFHFHSQLLHQPSYFVFNFLILKQMLT